MRPRSEPASATARGPRIFGYPGWLALCLAWTLFGSLSYLRGHASDTGAPEEYLLWLTCYLPWIVLTPLVIAIERRLPLAPRRWPRSLAALIALSLPIAYAAWILTAVFAAAVRAMFQIPGSPPWRWLVPAGDLLGHEALFWASVAAACLIRKLHEARENEWRAAALMLEKSRLEASLRQSELDVLRIRLHPHFLFNSLQNISVLAEHDPRTGSRMLTRLGALLRASLDKDLGPETTLQAEIDLTRTYLAVEQMRFGDRLTSLVDVGAGPEGGTEVRITPPFRVDPAARADRAGAASPDR